MGHKSNPSSPSILDALRASLASDARLGEQFKADRLDLDLDGVLILEGEVGSVAQKKIALETAAAMPEITGIVDRVRVRPAEHMGDAEIRAHLRREFSLDPSLSGLAVREVRGNKVKAVVEISEPFGSLDYEVVDGIVTLNGSVTDLAIKRYVGVLAWWVPGTRDVINGIVAASDESDGPDRIADAVRLVLEKNPCLDAAQIKVGVRNRVVRLTGYLPSQTQSGMAANDAWCVFGVDEVINQIEIGPQ